MIINTLRLGLPRHVASAFIDKDTGELKLTNIHYCQMFPVTHIHGTILYCNEYFHLEKPFGDGVLFKGIFRPDGSCAITELHRDIAEIATPQQLVEEILRYRKEWPDFFR